MTEITTEAEAIAAIEATSESNFLEVWESLDFRWTDNENVMLAAIKKDLDADVLSEASKRLKGSADFLLKAIRANPRSAEEIGDLKGNWYANPDFMIQAAAIHPPIMEESKLSAQDWQAVWADRVAARGSQERPTGFVARCAAERAQPSTASLGFGDNGS